jgi:hypothetical protein
VTVFRGKRPKQEMKGAGMIHVLPLFLLLLRIRSRRKAANNQQPASQLVPRFPAHAVSGGQAGVTHSTHGGRTNKTKQIIIFRLIIQTYTLATITSRIFSSNILLFLPISESNSFQLEKFLLSHQRKIQ